MREHNILTYDTSKLVLITLQEQLPLQFLRLVIFKTGTTLLLKTGTYWMGFAGFLSVAVEFQMFPIRTSVKATKHWFM